MEDTTMSTKHRDKHGNTWKEAATKGALVWGSVYSTATSGAAYLLAPVMTGHTPAFGDIFMNSLIVFPTAGAMHGLAMWQVHKSKHAGKENPELAFTSKSREKHKHPVRIKKAA